MPEAAPDTAPLLEKLEAVKAEYVKLLNDKDVLIRWGKPQLEALYTARVGRFKLEILQQQLHIKALKRKIELAQAALARGTAPDFATIELQAAEELAAAEVHIMAEAAKIEAATQMLSTLDTPQRSADLRRIFKDMAKALHPDANPHLPDDFKRIWHQVHDAYAAGDLGRLRALEVVYEKELAEAGGRTAALSADEITLHTETLKEGVRVLIEELARIRSVFPFTIEAQIKDDDWVAQQQEECSAELQRLKEYEEELAARYAELSALG